MNIDQILEDWGITRDVDERQGRSVRLTTPCNYQVSSNLPNPGDYPLEKQTQALLRRLADNRGISYAQTPAPLARRARDLYRLLSDHHELRLVLEIAGVQRVADWFGGIQDTDYAVYSMHKALRQVDVFGSGRLDMLMWHLLQDDKHMDRFSTAVRRVLADHPYD